MVKHLVILLTLLCLLVYPVFAAYPNATGSTIIGFEWNQSSSSPTLSWIDSAGNPYTPSATFFDDHRIWGNMWRCTINPTTNALTFGSNARGDGLDLTGASGPVMVIIPKFYTKSEFSNASGYNIFKYWISSTNTSGYSIHPLFVQRGGTERDYVLLGAYEGSFKVDSSTGTLYFDSVTGRQPWTGGTGVSDGIFRLGFDSGTGSSPTIGQTVTGSASTQQGIVEGVYKSGGTWGVDATGIIYLSRPSGITRNAVFTDEEDISVGGVVFAKAESSIANSNYGVTMTNLQDFADNFGSDWGIENIWHQSAVQLLFYMQYGSLNSQTILGKGIVDKASGTGFAGEKTGLNNADSNIATNGTGAGTGTNGLTPIVWRGIENLWGNTWKYLIGFNSLNAEYRIAKRDGTGTLAETLAAGQYETSIAVPLSGNGIPADPMEFYRYGYITNVESEDLLRDMFLPSNLTGGGSTTYFSDYGYSHYTGASTRILLSSGDWGSGLYSGIAYRRLNYGVGYSVRLLGGRPEFIGTTNTTGMTNADFTANVTSGMAPLSVQFNDTTTGVGVYAWNWSFGDGNYSNDQNPVYTYTGTGTYDVSLTVTNIYNGTDVETKIAYISTEIPIADFTGTPTYGYVPLSVQFNDTSSNTPTSWNWSFGDGTYSTNQNATHIYTHSGLYNVSLNATNVAGSDTETKVDYINVSVMPNVIFSGIPLSGNTPLTVSFTDASTTAEGTIDTWDWMFGDGSPNSTTQNPTHTYTTSGLYSVSLTITNSFGISNTTTYTNYISASTPGSPTANFHGTPTSGTAPLTVTFFDDSTGSPTSWNWSFGDGQFSTLQNPVHTYSAVGVYTVSLNATNVFGSDVAQANDYIAVTAAPTPTQTPSNATGGTRGYSAEETAIPFWLWAVIIILGSALLIAGLFGRHLIFGIMSTMCFAAAAFASPMVSFFYQEVVLSNESEVAYSVFPMKWLVTQPWVAWLLWGMALLALLVVVYGVIVGMAEIKKPGDTFLEDDWLDKRDF